MLDLNTIHHGDCLDLMRHIPAGSVDMILCDLPYGTTACKWDTIIPFDKLWAQYERVIKPNGAIVLTASQPFTSALVTSNPKMFKYALVWDKGNASTALHANSQPLKVHEDVLVFAKLSSTHSSRGQMAYFPQDLTVVDIAKKNKAGSKGGYFEGKNGANSNLNSETVYKQLFTNYPKSILSFSREKGGLHPTQKPVALFEYLIRTYTNPGEVVLDNCAGSFTTSLAAENTGRQWICIEQEAKYCEIGRARLAARQPVLELA